MQAGLCEIPEVVVRLIKEVETIQSFYPTHFYVHIGVLWVRLRVRTAVTDKLIGTDNIAVGHHSPVIAVAIDVRNHVGRELKNLIADRFSSIEREQRMRVQRGHQN